ncbi:MAG: rod-binding protein [Limnohabitans sp.]
MNDAAPLTSARSYLDFSGLGELRGKAQRNDDSALRETAQQFEAMFIQMMLKSMRDASNEMKSDLVQSDAAETFEGMYDKEMSVKLAQRNALGLADSIVRNVQQRQTVVAAADALKQRDASGIPLNPPVNAMPLLRGEAKSIPFTKPYIKPLPVMPQLSPEVKHE